MNWGGTGFLRAGGAQLEYACYGPPPQKAPTLVLLHEGLGCVALWRDFPSKLAAETGCGVLVYSRAGYGQSDPMPLPWPLDYMSRHACEILPEVLVQAGVTRFILIGHSDGATISAVFAGSMKDPGLMGVVLIAPHFFTEPEGLTAIAAARDMFQTGNLRGKLGKYHADVDCAFRGWCDSWLNPDFEAWSVVDALKGVSVPILAVQGTADPYGTMAQIDVIVERCPNLAQRCVVPDIGHAPHLEAPNDVKSAISEFVGGLL